MEIPQEITPKCRERIGVDLGINTLATASDGTTFSNPKAYKAARKKLARLQRHLSRKVKGSKNRAKCLLKVQKLHQRVANIRCDTIHKITTFLAKNHSQVVIEDLNVSGMLKNHCLAGSIADASFYEFRRQLDYKSSRYGSKLIIADRFYPSSQLCSNCGHRQKMPLNQRTFECQNCGLAIDRDLNASINLEKSPGLGDYTCGRGAADSPGRSKKSTSISGYVRVCVSFIEQFLATMSHELRTPMNSILGFSQVLLRGRRHPLAPQQKQMVERILKNGKQLLALIDDILDLSKIEAGHSELKLEEFEVDLLVAATCEELRIFAQHKNLMLQFNSILDYPRVVGDRLRLRQVVTNLISNAIKFTTSGMVEVSISSPCPDWVEILVKDTGIGIPPEQLNHVFEAFRQGDQTTTREYSGTGLGLALCDSLIRLMKGTISVESQLNKGSTFSIQIPRSISTVD